MLGTKRVVIRIHVQDTVSLTDFLKIYLFLKDNVLLLIFILINQVNLHLLKLYK